MAGTVIIKCNCKVGAYKFQEEQHGVGNRVANVGSKGDTRCTCCCGTRKSKRQLLTK